MPSQPNERRNRIDARPTSWSTTMKRIKSATNVCDRNEPPTKPPKAPVKYRREQLTQKVREFNMQLIREAKRMLYLDENV